MDTRLKIVIAAVGSLVLLTGGASGCDTDAQVVSQNLSTDADQFKISRRIVFLNGITDKYLMVIEGKCSIAPSDKKLDVTCKVGDNQYKKHFLGLSDNVSYFVEQVEGAGADPNHYKVIFKPEALLPDFERP